jgi:predicted nuclease of restriction endonuclease-like RecB superfamily
MLTVDFVTTRRKNHVLELVPLKETTIAQLIEIAGSYVLLFESSLYARRDELEGNCNQVPVSAYLKKMTDGLLKLLNDRSTFSSPEDVDPQLIRDTVFRISAQHRLNLKEKEHFDRNAVLLEASTSLGIDVFRIDECLFGDLKEAQRLIKFDALTPQQLVKEYQLAREQAVLQRATELTVCLKCDDTKEYRYFFRQLKFHRLLYELKEIEEGMFKNGYEVKISGPHQLFKSVTKYGLQLALLLPSLRYCQKWKLSAKLLWGKAKEELDFFLNGDREQISAQEIPMPEEAEQIVYQIKNLGDQSPWKVRRAIKIFNVPGVGICIPDLLFTKDDNPDEKIYLEMMGYWNREAIFKRIDLCNSGLQEKFIFAYSERLRVNEGLLDSNLPAALLSYKGTIGLRTLFRKLDELSGKKITEIEQDLGKRKKDEKETKPEIVPILGQHIEIDDEQF